MMLLQLCVLFIVLVVNCSAQSWRDCMPCKCYMEEYHAKADCRPSFTQLPLKSIPSNLSQQVNYLELSHQRIYKDIPEDVFFHANVSHLSKLRLHRCAIENIHKHAFRHLINLTWLDISHNEIEQLEVGIFHVSDWLDTLWINGNKYRSLNSGLFANLLHLEYVYAYENLISYIAPDAFQNNPKLREVDLSDNKLTQLEKCWLDFPNLRDLKLTQNPWHCDCKLTALISEFRRHNLPSDDLECASPLYLMSESVKRLTTQNMCPGKLSLLHYNRINNDKDGSAILVCRIEGLVANVKWIYTDIKANQHILKNSTKYLLTTDVDDTLINLDQNRWLNLTVRNISIDDQGTYKCSGTYLYTEYHATQALLLIQQTHLPIWFIVITSLTSIITLLAIMFVIYKAIMRVYVLRNKTLKYSTVFFNKNQENEEF